VNAGDGGITLQWPKDETIVAAGKSQYFEMQQAA